jgi:hypothetical protein
MVRAQWVAVASASFTLLACSYIRQAQCRDRASGALLACEEFAGHSCPGSPLHEPNTIALYDQPRGQVIKRVPSGTPFQTDEVGLLEHQWIQIRLCTGEVGFLNPAEDFGYAISARQHRT